MHMMANDSQEYCLRWNKHVANFAESFLSLLQNETLVDVSLLAEGKQFKAHKIVLSICSTYFQDAFKDLRDKHPIVILKDVKADHLKALLDYMYKGQVNVAHEELDYFLKTAQSLGIKGFQEGLADNGDLHSTIPISHLRAKPIDHYRKHRSPVPPPPPATTPQDTKPVMRHLPAMYSVPSTSVNSVLSTALTMPSSLCNLASPMSLNHLPQLSPSLVSTLASTFSHALPNPMLASPFATPHHILPSMNSEHCDSPQSKRRRKHRRTSGGTMDSGDSDGRSSGSPGDSAVPNLILPRIPAKIIPVEDLRKNSHNSHQLNRPSQSHIADQQPKDLSIHSSQKYSTNNHDYPSQKSSRLPPLVKTPTSMPSFLSIDAHVRPQEEPENLEHRRPSPPFSLLHGSGIQRFMKPDPSFQDDNNERCSSSHASINSVSRRSDRQCDERSDRRSAERSDRRSAERSDRRSAERSDRRSAERSDRRSAERSDRRSAERSDRRSAERSERRSDERSDRRSDDRSDRRSNDRSMDRSEDHRSSELPRSPSKHSSDPESIVSPSKDANFQNRNDDSSSDNDNHYSDDEIDENETSNGARERYADLTPGPSSSRSQNEEIPQAAHGYLPWSYHEPSSTDEALNIADNSNQGLWKNSFKGGLLAPYLGSPLGSLPRSPHSHGFSSTFPGLYPGHGVSTINWGRRSSSPPSLLPPHLRSNECSRCGRLYKTRKGLKHHIKNECGVEPRFQCTHCDWKFKQKAHLLRHMARKHTIS